MTRRLFSIGATAAAVAFAAILASAQGAPPPDQQPGRGRPAHAGRGPAMGPRGAGPGRGLGLAGLDLSEDQRTKITDLERATRDQAAPIRDELQFTRKSLHRELFADKRDTAKVASLSAKIATFEKQLADLHVKSSSAVADLLTPTQRETMRAARAPRGPAAGGRGGRGAPPQ